MIDKPITILIILLSVINLSVFALTLIANCFLLVAIATLVDKHVIQR